MTNLPEDSNRWPSDPFKLLGIERTSDARTARRAYFKLVRRYRPDRHPTEFQKVREAFEQVENWLKWNVHPRSDLDDFVGGLPVDGNELSESYVYVPDNDDDLPTQSPDESEENSNADENDQPIVDPDQQEVPSNVEYVSADSFHFPELKDPFEQFQQSLNSGDIAAAVARINELEFSAGPSQTARANLTKYYLSRFVPDAMGDVNPPNDSTEHSATKLELKRISWLLKSMCDSEMYHPAIQRLRDEFDRNYRLAQSAPVKMFLSEAQGFAKLAEVYKLRWEAIGHSDWQIVVDDVESLKPRSLEFDDLSAGWVDLLAASMEYTVWHTDQRCATYNRECWREISESQRSWTADAVELMVLAAEEWRRMRDFFQWSSALPWARNTLPGTVRQIWLPVANSIAADRNRSLQVLNQLFRSHAIAMSYFEEGLRQLSSYKIYNETDESWDETRDLVACFFANGSRRDYAASRRHVLDFCVLNQVEPMRFAHAANTFLSTDSPVSWTELMQNDGPLLCVYNACKSVGF